MAILYPTSLANLVAEGGTRHSHQLVLFKLSYEECSLTDNARLWKCHVATSVACHVVKISENYRFLISKSIAMAWLTYRYWPPGLHAALLSCLPGVAVTYFMMEAGGGGGGGGGGGSWQRWVTFTLACVSRFMSGSLNAGPAYLFDLKTQFGLSQPARKCRSNKIQIFINSFKPWACVAPSHCPN